MMWLLWNGGHAYADSMAHDRRSYEAFESTQDAIDAIWRRASGDSYYPNAHAENSGGGWLYAGSREPWTEEDPYPDSVIEYDNESGKWTEGPS